MTHEFHSVIEVLDKHPSLCVALASILSALISAAITLTSAFIVRSSEKKLRREALAIQIGVDAFKNVCELAKQNGRDVTIVPQETWLLSALKFMEVLDLKKMDEKSVVTKIRECIAFSAAIDKVISENPHSPSVD